MSCQSSYLVPALDVNRFVNNANGLIERIKLSGIQFDSIAFSGMSGSLVVPIIAMLMGKNMLLGRKERDDCHSSYQVEGNLLLARRFIIIDDLVSSGDTVRRINGRVKRSQTQLRENGEVVPEGKCVGLFCYNEHWRSPSTEMFALDLSNENESKIPWIRSIGDEPILDKEREELQAFARVQPA